MASRDNGTLEIVVAIILAIVVVGMIIHDENETKARAQHDLELKARSQTIPVEVDKILVFQVQEHGAPAVRIDYHVVHRGPAGTTAYLWSKSMTDIEGKGVPVQVPNAIQVVEDQGKTLVLGPPQ